MKSFYIMDVADVTFRRKSDRHTVFTSEAQMSSLSQTVDEEAIQGGIGSKTLYTIKSNKQMELTVRNATFDLEWMAMTQGVSVENGSVTVMKEYKGTVEDGAVAIEATVSGNVSVLNGSRKSVQLEATAGSVTIDPEFAEEGEDVTVIVDEEVTGQTVKIRADKFSEKYEVQYRTVVYERETSTHVADLYILFNEVSPSSAVDLSLENGAAFTPELTFTASADNNGEIGEMIQTPIGETP